MAQSQSLLSVLSLGELKKACVQILKPIMNQPKGKLKVFNVNEIQLLELNYI